MVWLARGLFAVSVGLLAAFSYFYAAPYVYAAHWKQLGQPLALLVSTGVPLLLMAAFAWIWPAAGGIIASLYGIWQCSLAFDSHPDILLPVPVVFLLYAFFTAGGVLSFIWGYCRYKRAPPRSYPRKLALAADVCAFTTVALAFVLSWFLHPAMFVLGAVPGLVIAALARLWHAPGGVLMLALGAWACFPLAASSIDPPEKAVIYALCALFMLAGLLHLVLARRGHVSETLE